MIARPTTTVDVMRGTTTDDYGSVIDAATVVAAGVRASIIERQQRVHEPKSGEDRIIRVFKCRVPPGTLLKGDRVRDRTTGSIYVVDNLYQQANPFWSPDQAADLSLTT